MPLVVSCSVMSSGSRSSALEHRLAGDGQVVADLRPLVQRPAHRHHVVQQVAGFVAQCLGGHARMLITAS